MLSLEKCIVESLDGDNEALLPFMAYILQDSNEIGSDPELMLALVKSHSSSKHLRILDLGCGKGAVAIHLASELQCQVHGIDAMPDFIEAARRFAHIKGVTEKVHFEVADIRTRIFELRTYDLVVLGAIGPVLGDLQTTLSTVREKLADSGYVLLDDAYVPDHAKERYPRCLPASTFYEQISAAGYAIVAEEIFNNELDLADDNLLKDIKKRVEELKLIKPEMSLIFDAYMQQQAYETEMLKHLLVTGTWLLQKL
jgi:cyclopropane fatty-acyl-phospholipid synthase-like methyltransferase